MRSKYALAACSVLFLASAQAEPLVEGSIEAGEAKSVPCAACHGRDGNSANPAWPSIAGQNAPYIVQQLQAFKEGTRNDPLMTPQAMALSEEDMRDLAAFFASQTAAPRPVPTREALSRGQTLYRGGDAEREAAACLACHGPTGRGNPAAAYPMLRGQYATYTAKQLRAYASGERKSDGSTRIMRDIASRLSEDDIVAVSSYIQGLK